MRNRNRHYQQFSKIGVLFVRHVLSKYNRCDALQNYTMLT